jgi:hypothetical protein
MGKRRQAYFLFPSLLPLLDSPLKSAIHAKNTKWLMEEVCFIFYETPWCTFVPLWLFSCRGFQSKERIKLLSGDTNFATA